VNQLFIHCYLDEDVSVLIAQLLRARGFNAVTTVEAGRRGAKDIEQLAFAASSNMALVTHNHADFETLAAKYLARGLHHSRIIIAVRHSPYEITRRLFSSTFALKRPA
jgi:predicted nuclease of predicted toxin-antitoxin system